MPVHFHHFHMHSPTPLPSQVTAFKLDPARLAGLNPRLRGMRVGNFSFTDDQLRLGDLRGNRCVEAGGLGPAGKRARCSPAGRARCWAGLLTLLHHLNTPLAQL